MLADSGSRLVVVDETALDVVRSALGELGPEVVAPTVVVTGAEPGEGELALDDLRADVVRPVPPLPDPEKLAALLYTSGASGLPRAAMLSHRALLSHLRSVASFEILDSKSVVLAMLPTNRLSSM